MALARKYRLLKKDLERVFKRGKTVRSSFFFIRFLKNNLNHLRAAAIVPSKVFKKATERNHLKRLMTEAIRAGHFLESSFDIVIVATANIVGKQSKEINREIEQTIKKVLSQLSVWKKYF